MIASLFNPRFHLPAVAFLASALCAVPQDAARSLAAGPHHLLHWALSPLTRPLTHLSNAVRRPADGPLGTPDYAAMQREYLQARQYLAALEQELAQERAKNAALKRLAEAGGLQGYTYADAFVIGSCSARNAPALTINRGSRHGLLPGLVVFDDRVNLVGRISDLGAGTATVRLITAPGTALTVRLLPPDQLRPPQPLELQLTASRQGGQFEATLTDAAASQIGVGWHALLYDADWIQGGGGGFLVGVVAAVEPLPDNPIKHRRVVVRPVPSLLNLTRVYVAVPRQ